VNSARTETTLVSKTSKLLVSHKRRIVFLKKLVTREFAHKTQPTIFAKTIPIVTFVMVRKRMDCQLKCGRAMPKLLLHAMLILIVRE
jgi:hypothetical protein